MDAKVIERIKYVLACVEVHADKFPVPSHMKAHVAVIRTALSEQGEAAQPAADGWRPINDDHPAPPHAVPVLLWSPPSMSHPDGHIEARPFSTGRSGPGWSEYSQHSWATHWMPLPASPGIASQAEEGSGNDG